MNPHNAGNSANTSHERMAIENRIRMKHNEIAEDERTKQSYEHEIARIQSEIKHTADTMKRMETESNTLSRESEKGKSVSRQAEDNGRTKDQEILRKNDEIKKIEQDLGAIKRQSEEKEREMNDVKGSLRQLIKEREDLRNQFETGSFSAREDGTHAHDKEVRLHQLEMENNGKEAEVARKEREIAHLKQDIMRKQQDLVQLETQLRKFN